MLTVKQTANLVQTGIDWEIAFFNFVDAFRAAKTRQDKLGLIVEAPESTGNARFDSLLQAMVLYLLDEAEIMESIEWLEKDGWLSVPWFVCGLSRLYSFSLVETPIRFKQNNIFVLSNFMDRV